MGPLALSRRAATGRIHDVEQGMTMKTASMMTLAAGCALLLGGCASTPPEGGYRIDNQNAVNPTLDTVRVIDNDLAHYGNRRFRVRSMLDVEHATVTRTTTGLPRISVELRNKSGEGIPLEVRTSWYDEAGRPIDAAGSWTHLFLQPMAMSLYEQNSVRPGAAHYYVEVRGAQ